MMIKACDLIKEFCPNSVPYMTLGELGTFYGGLTGKSKKDFESGNARYISYMNIYKNMEVDVTAEDFVQIAPEERQNKVALGDVFFTGSSETKEECAISSVLTVLPEGDLYLNSFCFGFRINNPDLFLPSFLKHLFRSGTIRKDLQKTASGVTRFNVSKDKMAKVRIPVPPKDVQKKIASILDEYAVVTSTLINTLESELDSRRVQYKYYSELLFSSFPTVYQESRLELLADIGTGSSNTNEAEENGKYPFFVRAQEPLRKNEYEFDEAATITAGDGVGVGKVFNYVDGKYALHQRAYRIHVKTPEVLDKYIYYYFRFVFPDYIAKKQFEGSVASIRRPMLNAFVVKYPASLEEQEKIIKKAETLDRDFAELERMIRKEIRLRQIQYTYYSNTLLAFPR